MKKTSLMIVLCLFAIMFSLNNAVAQQGKWAGIVKYALTWSGNVPQGVPSEYQTKVYNNLEGTPFTIYIGIGGLCKTIANADNNTITIMYDFSMFPDEGVTEGMQGKWYMRKKVEAKDFDEATYNYTGKTKQIAGMDCQEVVVVFKPNEEGEQQKNDTIFVTKELGPKVDFYYYPGLDAFPMEFPIDLSPELRVVMTVSDLQKGKVKEEDLLLESGYEEVTEEDMNEWMQKLRGAGAGASEDDM